MKNYKQLFVHRDFVKLIVGSVISSLGSNLTLIALPLFAYQMTQSKASIGILFAFETAPWILLGPFAGAWADRYSRKNILIFCNLASAILMIVFAFTGSLAFMCLMALGMGASNTLNASAYGAALPVTLPRDQFQLGFSLHSILTTAMRLLSPALGGFLLHFIHAKGLFFIDALTFFVAAVAATVLSGSLTPSVMASITASAPILKRIKMLCAKRTLLFPLTFEWAVTLADAITTPLLVVLITGTFALTASTFGYLHAAGGIGSLIGSYLAGHYFKKTGNYYAIFFGGLLLFCSYFVISFPLPVFILFFVRLLGQCGEGVRQVKVHTYFGTETDDASRGSMIGLINASISIVYVFGYILSGLAVTWIDIRVVFMVTALLSAVLYLGIFIKGNARSHDRGESL